MGRAKVVVWERDKANGQRGYRYDNIFMSDQRLEHCKEHASIPTHRRGVHSHGVWHLDSHYTDLDQMILAYAAKAARRINQNSNRVRAATHGHHGRTLFRIQLSKTAHIGTADDRDILPGRGIWYYWTHYADIVFDPKTVTENGYEVYPIVTFFPTYPKPTEGTPGILYEFVDSAAYVQTKEAVGFV